MKSDGAASWNLRVLRRLALSGAFDRSIFSIVSYETVLAWLWLPLLQNGRCNSVNGQLWQHFFVRLLFEYNPLLSQLEKLRIVFGVSMELLALNL